MSNPALALEQAWSHYVDTDDEDLTALADAVQRAVYALDRAQAVIGMVAEHFEGTDSPLGDAARQWLGVV